MTDKSEKAKEERKLTMDGDEAIAQLKKLVGTCGNELDGRKYPRINRQDLRGH